MRVQNEMMELNIKALANLFQGANDRYLSGAKTLNHELERLKELLLPLNKILAAARGINNFDIPLPLDQFLPLTEILGDRVSFAGGGSTNLFEGKLADESDRSDSSRLRESPNLFEGKVEETLQKVISADNGSPNLFGKKAGAGQTSQTGQTIKTMEAQTRLEAILSKIVTAGGTSIEEIMQRLPEKGVKQQQAISRLKEIIADKEVKRTSVGEEVLAKIVEKVSLAVEEVKGGSSSPRGNTSRRGSTSGSRENERLNKEEQKRVITKLEEMLKEIEEVAPLAVVKSLNLTSVSTGTLSKVLETAASALEYAQKVGATNPTRKPLSTGYQTEEIIPLVRDLMGKISPAGVGVGGEISPAGVGVGGGISPASFEAMLSQISKTQISKHIQGQAVTKEVLERVTPLGGDVGGKISPAGGGVGGGISPASFEAMLSQISKTQISKHIQGQAVTKEVLERVTPLGGDVEGEISPAGGGVGGGISPASFEAMLSQISKTQISKHIQGQAVTNEVLERITKEGDSRVKGEGSQLLKTTIHEPRLREVLPLYDSQNTIFSPNHDLRTTNPESRTLPEVLPPNPESRTVIALQGKNTHDSLSFPPVCLDAKVEQWWRENREVLREQRLVSRLKEEMVTLSSNSKSGHIPQVNNTFNIQVYPEELKNKLEMNNLAEKINKILVNQARRYGIEV